MKYLFLLFALLILGCSEDPVCPNDPDNYVSIEVVAGNRFVETASVYISENLRTIRVGNLPFSVNAEDGGTITAHFSSDASNWDINHLDCDCEAGYRYRFDCTQTYAVNGPGTFEIGGE